MAGAGDGRLRAVRLLGANIAVPRCGVQAGSSHDDARLAGTQRSPALPPTQPGDGQRPIPVHGGGGGGTRNFSTSVRACDQGGRGAVLTEWQVLKPRSGGTGRNRTRRGSWWDGRQLPGRRPLECCSWL